MRRLPVYFLVDVSETMSQSALVEILRNINVITSEYQRIPYALESMDISIISFASQAHIVVPLTELTELDLSTISNANFVIEGEASPKLMFDYMMRYIDVNVIKLSENTKEDHAPIVFHFSLKKNNTLNAFMNLWNNEGKRGVLAVFSVEENKIFSDLIKIANLILEPYYVGGTLGVMFKLKQKILALNSEIDNFNIICK